MVTSAGALVRMAMDADREIRYCHERVKEAEAVIKQLSAGFRSEPYTGPIYIHPADLHELLDKMMVWQINFDPMKVPDPKKGIRIGDNFYIASTLMPQRTKNIS